MMTKTERANIRGRLLRAKLAAKAKRSPAQIAASKANIQKAQKALHRNRLRMWF